MLRWFVIFTLSRSASGARARTAAVMAILKKRSTESARCAGPTIGLVPATLMASANPAAQIGT